MVKTSAFVLVILLSALYFETANATFQIRAIRIVLRKAERYASATMGEGLTGNVVAKVLRNIDRTLAPLGFNYWVSMEEFANAAVRVGLSRNIGIAVYHVVDSFF